MDHSNATELARETGWTPNNVTLKLRRANVKATSYRSGVTGRVHDYYPTKEALAVLGIRTDTNPPAGAWLTANRIHIYLNRSRKWVDRRLTPYSLLAKPRKDDCNISRPHYPPEVYRDLKAVSDAERGQLKLAA